MQYPIPQDWTPEDGYTYYVLCWPCSLEWSILLRALLRTGEKGRFWDANTGSIKDIQSTFADIVSSNTDTMGVFMGCNDLITTLGEIRAAIDAIEAVQIDIQTSAEAQASAQTNLNVSINNMAQAIAVSQAWSNSIAQVFNYINVEVTVSQTLNTVSPTQPPNVADVAETSFTDTLADSDYYCGRVVFLVDGAIEFFRYLQATSVAIGTLTINTAFGWISEALYAVAAYFGWLALPVPAASLAILASNLFAEFVKGSLSLTTDAAYNFVLDRRDEIVCALYNAATAGDDTSIMRDAIKTILENDLQPSAVQSLVLTWFNPTALGLVYFVSNLVDLSTQTSDECDALCGV